MKWHVKIYLAPFVQETPEEFEVEGLRAAMEQIYGLTDSARRIRSIREIRITPSETKEPSGD